MCVQAQAKRLMGTKRHDPLWAVKKASIPVKSITPLAALPTSFNATANWPACPIIGHIRDQSDCGSCWAHGSTEAINDRFCIVHGLQVQLSQQDTASCCDSNQGCDGSQGCDGGFPQVCMYTDWTLCIQLVWSVCHMTAGHLAPRRLAGSAPDIPLTLSASLPLALSLM